MLFFYLEIHYFSYKFVIITLIAKYSVIIYFTLPFLEGFSYHLGGVILGFLSAVYSVLPIILIIFIGYILSYKGWFDEKASQLFSKLTVNISLPALMFYTVSTNISKNELIHMGSGLLVAFLSIFISYMLAHFLIILFKFDKKKIGLFSAIFAFSNTIFVGLPVNEALFGNKSIPYVLLYYVANTTLFWTMGLYAIRKDVEDTKKFSIFDALKKIVSPPLLGYIVGVLVILLNIEVPKFILDTANYIGQLTTPLSMIFIGITIYLTDLKNFRIDKVTNFLLIGKNLVTPFIVILMLHFIKVDPLMGKVLVIQSALPVMTQITIVSSAYKNDKTYPAVITAITNILSLIVIPIYMYIVNLIF